MVFNNQNMGTVLFGVQLRISQALSGFDRLGLLDVRLFRGGLSVGKGEAE